MKKRSKFSLSHYRLLTCKMGYIIPCGFLEVLPGDSIRMATSLFMRLAPMLAPVMHPCHVTIHHWYVPTRLVLPAWETFITGGPDGMDVTELPTVTPPTDGFAEGSLADYLGLPTGMDIGPVSALPFRAYALIYNEWYRDQDLEDPLEISTEPGPDTTTSTSLMRGDWERDIFTTARPWPQKGPGVTVPVNGDFGSNQIVSNGKTILLQDGQKANPTTGQSIMALASGSAASSSSNVMRYSAQQANINAYTGLAFGSETGLKLTSSSGSASVDINQLREAFALQRFEEHRAMYGSRYTEYLRYLGVRSSDARLQRPEYLGGGKQTIQFSEVLQTAQGTDPVGTLRGHGIAAMRSNRFRYFIEEHGMILSFLMIRPKAIYSQGIDRFWLKKVKEDFWQKELQHIGQQEVWTKELYGSADADTVFGWQNRYDEYRQHWSSVSGEFRSILDYWHMARVFANEPVLNADFISAVPTERIFAAQQNDQLYVMANHSIQARRLMAKFGNPI